MAHGMALDYSKFGLTRDELIGLARLPESPMYRVEVARLAAAAASVRRKLDEDWQRMDADTIRNALAMQAALQLLVEVRSRTTEDVKHLLQAGAL